MPDTMDMEDWDAYRDRRKRETIALIRVIACHLNKKDKESRYLWDILTALRGPDDKGSSRLKRETTEKLRFAMGMEPDRTSYAYVGDELPHKLEDYEYPRLAKVDCPPPADEPSEHFIRHFERAVDALWVLGITRTVKLNPPEEL